MSLGEVAVQAGNLHKAATHFDTAARVGPGGARALVRGGAVRVRAGDSWPDLEETPLAEATRTLLEEGVDHLREGLARWDHPESQMLLGAALLRLGRSDEGERELDRAAAAARQKRAPWEHRAEYFHALALMQVSREADALGAARRAAAADTSDCRVARLLGRLALGAGELEEAASAFRRALASRPEDGLALEGLGHALYRLGRFAESIQPLRAAAASGRSGASLFCGRALLTVGDSSAAIEVLRAEAARDARSGDAVYFLGCALASQGVYVEAETILSRAVELGMPGAHRERGHVRALSGDAAGALEDYESALRKAPDDRGLRCRRAWALALGGHDGEALEYLSSVERSTGSGDAGPVALEHRLAGLLYERAGRFREAATAYRAALSPGPADEELWGRWIVVATRAGDNGDVAEALVSLASPDQLPDDGLLWGGVAALKVKDSALACRLWQVLDERRPGDSFVRHALAVACLSEVDRLQVGDAHGEAVALWRRAVGLGVTDPATCARLVHVGRHLAARSFQDDIPDLALARDVLDVAARLSGGDAGVELLLGVLRLLDGDPEAAGTAFTNVATCGDDTLARLAQVHAAIARLAAGDATEATSILERLDGDRSAALDRLWLVIHALRGDWDAAAAAARNINKMDLEPCQERP